MHRRWTDRITPLSLLLLCTPLRADHLHGTVEGRVAGPQGRALAGVRVEARMDGRAFTAVSDAGGSYRLPLLPPGGYQLTFQAPGFAIAVRRGVSARGGETTVLDVRMAPPLEAEVVISDKASFTNLADLDDGGRDLAGLASSASVGVVSAKELDGRPASRATEVLEAVPGLLISQHSGSGKANQYYLRGFNLDHGSDLAITIAGLPVNLPTHAHYQGYADANFLIPELISGIQYKKGPYFAEEGDFSSAGAVNVNYVSTLEKSLALLEAGAFGHRRALLASSPHVGKGHLLYAVEGFRTDGPWDYGDDLRRGNLVLGYSRDAWKLTAMAYTATWHSTDQVPSRAVDRGLISKWGLIDPTDGGRSHRVSLAWDGQWGGTRAQAFAFHYGVNLWSNFTYFLDDPLRGDQIEQEDRRFVGGAKLTHQWVSDLGGLGAEHTLGLQLRRDDIGPVGLHHTQARERLQVLSSDRVLQQSAGLFWQGLVRWTDAFRSTLGLRADHYRFDVRSDLPGNSGRAQASLLSPKLSLAFGPFGATEIYANHGWGFHSNDGRGAVPRLDPRSGDPLARVDPLVRAKGTELGLRGTPLKGWHTTLSFWRLDIASELLMVGDTGTTEASRPSRRMGVEWTNAIALGERLWINLDGATSKARFTDGDPVGDRIPGAVDMVGALGLTWKAADAFQAALKVRHVGPRPLLEDNRVRTHAETITHLRMEWSPRPGLALSAELLNAFNAQGSDIDYYYASRLPGEPAQGVEDLHTHPDEPRNLRMGVSWRF